MTAVRIAVLDDYQHAAASAADWSVLDGRAATVFFHDAVPDTDALVDRLQAFDVVVAMRERTRFDADLFARLPRLRLIASAGSANAAIDLVAAREHGVTVCGTDGLLGAHATIEHAWALILAASRRIVDEHQSVRAGGWQTRTGSILHGRTLGIVGLGNLGRAMIPIARAFGMTVQAWSRNLTHEQAAEAGAVYRTREEFFATSDVVTVHLKLSGRSVGYVGESDLRAMKPDALLVNTSRGPVVDETSLVCALSEGWIGGAALDVFDREPLPRDHPLRSTPRTLLSPHKGYVTRETYREYYRQLVDDVVAYLDGRPVRELPEPT